MISLRPVGGHGALRRAAAAEGARVLALSPWRLVNADDARTRRDLRAALAAERVVFTSPPAVRAAAALATLRPRRGQHWLAVGNGTASALRRAGIATAEAPQRMDSEGLLALPALQAVRGLHIGLVTAPDGRDAIAAALRSRGARVARADVYRRVPIEPVAAAAARLAGLRERPWLALSSGEALRQILAGLPPASRAALLRARVVAASARLAGIARAAGFEGPIAVAASARPGDLVAAAADASIASIR